MMDEKYERALSVLLRRPGVDFVRGLRSSLERDPGYLKAHQEAIILGVRELLDSAGIFWDTQAIKDNAMNLIREAVERVQVVEKEQDSK
jgi:hypothetical protein